MSLHTPLPTTSRMSLPRTGSDPVRRSATSFEECRRRIESADISHAGMPAVRLPTDTEKALQRVKNEQQERVNRSTPTPHGPSRR